MLNFFKKKTVAGGQDSVPAPLAGREGHVGGIEAISLDGVRYFFGFDFGNDLVVSPLIPDIDLMARFASRHMRQRDGEHDAAYWLELAEYAVDDSELCSDAAKRSFSTQGLEGMMRALARARDTDSAAPDFALEYHLQYLLGAAGGWVVDSDDLQAAIAFVAGAEPLPEGISYAHMAATVQSLLGQLTGAAPANWSTLFAVLKTAAPA